MLKPYAAVYAIEHLDSGRVYVGSTINLERRKRDHLRELRNSKHDNQYLQRTWSKYGAESFDFTVLERVEQREDLFIREQFWIDTLRSSEPQFGFNLNPIAYPSGKPEWSEESKAKASLRMKENGNFQNPEIRAKCLEALKGNQNWKHRVLSEESREKIREANRRREFTPELRAKLAANSAGKKRSPESIAKQSAALTGRKSTQVYTEEIRARMSEAQKGKKKAPISEETRKKMSEASRGRVVSEEARENMRKSWERRRLARETSNREVEPESLPEDFV